MSLSGLNGPATSTNAAYEMRKGRERQDISDYDVVVQGQPPFSQPQSGWRGYEIPRPPKRIPAVPAVPPPVVISNQERKEGAQEEAVYDPVPK